MVSHRVTKGIDLAVNIIDTANMFSVIHANVKNYFCYIDKIFKRGSRALNQTAPRWGEGDLVGGAYADDRGASLETVPMQICHS